MMLSKHFSIQEFTVSEIAARNGICNFIPQGLYPVAQYTAQKLDTIRDMLGTPVVVTSGYRCPQLNDLIGGEINSQHVKCEAADIIAPKFGSPLALAQFLERRVGILGIDQLILEFDRWVHVSFVPSPRKQALTARMENGKKKYVSGIV